MPRRPLLGHRLERFRVQAGLTEADAADALKLSRVDVLRGYERGDRIPSAATLHRLVDVYTQTEHYLDNYGLWQGADSPDDQPRPPDVAIAELLELRGRLIAHRRRLRLADAANQTAAVACQSIVVVGYLLEELVA